MTTEILKQHILESDAVDNILEQLGCHHITHHGGYITAGNCDGDNPSAIVCYLNDNLTVINYTRQLSKDQRTNDIFDLIMFCLDYTFPEAIKWVCGELGIDYYEEEEERPESLEIIQWSHKISTGADVADNTPTKPIDPIILTYYLPYGNAMWENEGISLDIQEEFNIGYDPMSNRITIPIFNEIGDLCGVKGRWWGSDKDVLKYLYLEPCNKSRILYGYYQNQNYIKKSDIIMIFESEKSVLKCASYGYRNCVGTGGKTISKQQIEMISRTGCKPCICFDKDVTREEIDNIANMFIDGIQVYAMIDESGLLHDKDSPCDNMDAFVQLLHNNIYIVKGDGANEIQTAGA